MVHWREQSTIGFSPARFSSIPFSSNAKVNNSKFHTRSYNAWTHRYFQTNCFLEKEIDKVFAIHLPPSY